MTARIEVDPNIRLDSWEKTYAGLEDVTGGPVTAGDAVLAVLDGGGEPDLVAPAVVDRVDERTRLVYLSVEWARFAPDPGQPST